MAFGNNSTSANALLKEFYSDEMVENMLFKEHVLFGLVSKKEDVDGKYFDYPIVVGAGMGRSATFANAQAMAALTGEVTVNFQVPLVENFEVANIANKLIMQAPKKDAGSFLDMVSLIANDQLENLGNDLAIGLYRSQAGDRGRIGASTTLASSKLTLANPRDIYNFEVGMALDLAQAQVTGGTRAYGSGNHGLYIVAIDYASGSFTVGTTPSPNGTACNITDATDGCPTAGLADYIYVSGDRNLKMPGLADWFPQTVASNDSFMNVNRSMNRVRLAGQFYDGSSGQSIASTLETAMAMVASVGGKTTHFLMDHMKFAQLSLELGAKTQLVDVKSTNADVGYTGIRIAGQKGTAVCLGDLHCPSDRIYGLNMDSLELMSMGKAAHVWDEDGQVWLRSATQAGMEIRFYSYAALRCSNPRSNIAIGVTAA